MATPTPITKELKEFYFKQIKTALINNDSESFYKYMKGLYAEIKIELW